jgi:hypothetical protein
MTAIAEPTPVHAPEIAFTSLASDETVERTAAAMRARGFDVHVVDGRDEARDLIIGMVPEGAEVGSGASVTLDELGVRAEIEGSGRYDALRPRLRSMDRATQGREIRKLDPRSPPGGQCTAPPARAPSQAAGVPVSSRGASSLRARSATATCHAPGIAT